MVRVLVIGATGYIGLELCRSLRRSSHVVYGLARSSEKERELAQNEVLPVRGTIGGQEYLKVVEEQNIDVVVDVSSAGLESYKLLGGLQEVGAERLRRRGGQSPKLGFIYTSGMSTHGDSLTRINDLNPVGLKDDQGTPNQPIELMSWRPEMERAIIEARDILDTMIIRPGFLYGKRSWTWAFWLEPLLKASIEEQSQVEIMAESDAVAPMVHVEDAALALHKAVERLSLVASSSVYPYFDVSSTREVLGPIILAAAKAMGFKGEVKFVKPEGALFEALSTSLRTDASRMRDLLGWKPERVTGMLDEIEIYVQSWKVYQLTTKVDPQGEGPQGE